ncbi:MAG: hypothetical protein ACKVX7_10125 [Planctomycetota bacterium]
MRTSARAAALACLWLGLVGCVFAQMSDGTSLRHAPVSEIEIGKSTRADVTRVLGPPDEVIYSHREHDPLFEQAYRYKRSKTRHTALFLIVFSTFRSDMRYDHIMVFFDEAGRVQHVGQRLDSRRASYGGPW